MTQVCIVHEPHMSHNLFGQARFTPARFAEYQYVRWKLHVPKPPSELLALMSPFEFWMRKRIAIENGKPYK